MELTDNQLLRYSRHILLPQVDVHGQLAICHGTALVVGVGGLGSPVALYLAAAGVGELILVDDDVVALTNLQRQVIHTEAHLEQPKVDSAKAALAQLNSDVRVTPVAQRLDDATMAHWVAKADVVLDCSDNFATRTALNAACWQAKVPLVSGAAIGFEGQLTVFNANNPQSPCYRCLYDVMNEQALSCAENGVLGPVVGVIGAAQALEALKLLGQFGTPLIGRVHFYDALKASWREIKLKRDPECKVCATTA